MDPGMCGRTSPAMNDVSRELGGALGIAVLGSLLNSAYRSGMEHAVAGLPPAALTGRRQPRHAEGSGTRLLRVRTRHREVPDEGDCCDGRGRGDGRDEAG